MLNVAYCVDTYLLKSFSSLTSYKILFLVQWKLSTVPFTDLSVTYLLPLFLSFIFSQKARSALLNVEPQVKWIGLELNVSAYTFLNMTKVYALLWQTYTTRISKYWKTGRDCLTDTIDAHTSQPITTKLFVKYGVILLFIDTGEICDVIHLLDKQTDMVNEIYPMSIIECDYNN